MRQSTRRSGRGPSPCSATCMPPCGSRIISATRPIVPIGCRSSGVGSRSSVGSCSVAVDEQAVAADDVLDERDRRLASDEDGQREVREQDRVAQRQDAEARSGRCGSGLCSSGARLVGRRPRRLSTTRGPGRCVASLASVARSTSTRVGPGRQLRQRDREHAVREVGRRAARVDRQRQDEPPFELAERDLDLQALGPRGPAADARARGCPVIAISGPSISIVTSPGSTPDELDDDDERVVGFVDVQPRCPRALSTPRATDGAAIAARDRPSDVRGGRRRGHWRQTVTVSRAWTRIYWRFRRGNGVPVVSVRRGSGTDGEDGSGDRAGRHPLRRRLRRRDAGHRRPLHHRDGRPRQRPRDASRLPGRDPCAGRLARRRLRASSSTSPTTTSSRPATRRTCSSR